LSGLVPAPGIYIPERAILHGSVGSFVWKLDAQHRATMQTVVAGAGYGNFVTIEQGLAEGDRIVVDGILKVAPGAAVRPVPIEQPVRQP
jgi:membrane fusion protein (multidrug efflux system)